MYIRKSYPPLSARIDLVLSPGICENTHITSSTFNASSSTHQISSFLLAKFLRLDSVLCLLCCSLQLSLKFLALTLDLTLGSLQALVVRVDPADLCGTNDEDQRIHSRKRNVLGADDEAPAGPDGSGTHERKVLCEGERLCGAGEVRCAGEDHAPFHYWCPREVLVRCLRCLVQSVGALAMVQGRFIPEVDSLGANGAVPEASEAARTGRGCCSSAAICLCWSEEGSEAAEDAGARAERHDCCLSPLFSQRTRGRR
jgi:hypothetical protein